MKRAFTAAAILGLCGIFAAPASGEIIASSGGWQVEVPEWVIDQGFEVDAVVDPGDPDVLIIEFAKYFTGDLNAFGAFDSIQVSFLPIEDEIQAGTILINDEAIQNDMVVDWLDFEMYLMNASDGTTFDASNAQFSNFQSLDEVDAVGIEPGQSLRFYNGVVPEGTAFFVDDIVINVDPDENGFILKEIPSIPEPATMSLLAFGAIAGLRRRRRR